jgi:hypothetical protein
VPDTKAIESMTAPEVALLKKLAGCITLLVEHAERRSRGSSFLLKSRHALTTELVEAKDLVKWI